MAIRSTSSSRLQAPFIAFSGYVGHFASLSDNYRTLYLFLSLSL